MLVWNLESGGLIPGCWDSKPHLWGLFSGSCKLLASWNEFLSRGISWVYHGVSSHKWQGKPWHTHTHTHRQDGHKKTDAVVLKCASDKIWTVHHPGKSLLTYIIWLVVSTRQKNISQIDPNWKSAPNRTKIKNNWNHHPVMFQEEFPDYSFFLWVMSLHVTSMSLLFYTDANKYVHNLWHNIRNRHYINQINKYKDGTYIYIDIHRKTWTMTKHKGGKKTPLSCFNQGAICQLFKTWQSASVMAGQPNPLRYPPQK